MITCKCKKPKWHGCYNDKKAKEGNPIELRCKYCGGVPKRDE